MWNFEDKNIFLLILYKFDIKKKYSYPNVSVQGVEKIFFSKLVQMYTNLRS